MAVGKGSINRLSEATEEAEKVTIVKKRTKKIIEKSVETRENSVKIEEDLEIRHRRLQKENFENREELPIYLL